MNWTTTSLQAERAELLQWQTLGIDIEAAPAPIAAALCPTSL